ncbi:M6 family metalloprotease domain-containing protein [Streptomyces sp. WMMB 322]|nr:M6 family metalloprotease domain-containing protein [Streptomyces sp. WMMB 322]
MMRGWRRAAAVFVALTAFIGMGLFAGPISAVAVAAPCALPRTDAHHSLGVDSWDPAYPRPRHRIDAVMIFLSFPDSRPQTTPRELTADHFPATSDFYRRASYGKFRLHTTFGKRWIRMPASSSSYGIKRDWKERQRTAYLRDAVAAADPSVDFGRYDLVYLVADPDARGVDSDATKVVNFDNPIEADGTELRRLVTVFEQSPPDRHVLAHETGHAFDLPDLYQRPASGLADWDTYVGDWDLMGSQFGLAPDLFAWEKWKLGWLTRRNVSCVPSEAGASAHTLRSLAAHPLGGRGDRRLAVVRTGRYEALAIEVRDSEGNDRGLCAEGVLLYWVRSDRASTYGPVKVVDGHPGTHGCSDGSVYPSLADAPLGEGESYTTDHGGGVRVEVTGRTADGGWRVKVTRKDVA